MDSVHNWDSYINHVVSTLDSFLMKQATLSKQTQIYTVRK
jgi:hypothetical protein